MSSGRGYRGGFNPFRDSRGRWGTAATHAGGGEGGATMNAAIRQASGRGEPAAPRSYGSAYTPAAAVTLRAQEERIRNQNFESIAIVGPDGALRAFVNGRAVSVKISNDQMKLLPGAILTHNHPPEEHAGDAQTSFSGQDILAGLNSGESETRAVTERYNHVAQYRKPGTQEPVNRKLTEAENIDIWLGLSDAYEWDRKAPPAQQRQQLESSVHAENIAMAKKYGYVYYREDLQTGEIEGYGHDV
ncbi:hypothetical protein K2Z83_28460 [Oscillochloris sp. ZM17-4]|uniref:hypothetical protein n=1 Tax=Oscillochloris sp. ZM17-4 TaxID=2866714 RepID=UPI001C73D14E|nr:hypothetical protein [Oscillochloris sp. ZM17-4]MBX0331589.1 hypothetical protein [Oscillochloris sp. ZM17-4]